MTASTAPTIAVVDAQNRFLRWTTRQEVHGQRLPHRSAYVLLFDSKHRLVVQRRHAQKLTWPNALDVSACGHVEPPDYPAGPDERLDEVYRGVATRELEEELGVKAELTFLGAFGPTPGVHYEHLQLFRGFSDGPYRAQLDEVSEIRSVTQARLLEWFDRPGTHVTHSLRHLVAWALAQGHWPG
jgi:isopentenyl-diphosphate delta-isomerase